MGAGELVLISAFVNEVMIADDGERIRMYFAAGMNGMVLT